MPFVPYVFTVVLLAVSVNTAPAQAAKRVKTTTNKQGKALNAAVTTAAISPAGVTYQGGALLNKVRVVPLYWGTQVTYNYDAFYCQAVSSTSFMDVFSQYGSGLASGTCSPGLVNENGANNGTVNVSAVEAYIISLIKNTTLNATGGSLYVPVHFGPVTVNSDTPAQMGQSCKTYCAYHDQMTITRSGTSQADIVSYGIIPEVTYGACHGRCGSAPTSFGQNTQIATHELGEAITDPGSSSWFNTNSGSEIGDLCSNQPGLDLGAFCGSDGYLYYVQSQWSNSANACVKPSPNASNCSKGEAPGYWPTSTIVTNTTVSRIVSSNLASTIPFSTASSNSTISLPTTNATTASNFSSANATITSVSSASAMTPSNTPLASTTSFFSATQANITSTSSTAKLPSTSSSSATSVIAKSLSTSSPLVSTCSHSECKQGRMLKSNCSACAKAICAQDSSCCTFSWDVQCVAEVKMFCPNLKCQ